MNTTFLLPAIITLVVLFVFFGRTIKQVLNVKLLTKKGNLSVANVLSISQSGTIIDQVPEFYLSLQIENIGGQTRQVQIKQLIDLGSIPRVGDKVYVLIDPNNPENVVLSPNPFQNNSATKVVDDKGLPKGTVNLSNDSVKNILSLSPELQQRGKLGVAIIVSIIPSNGLNSQITMDIDTIGQAPKRVILTQQIVGLAPSPGTRLYFLYDPQNPSNMALPPAGMMGGQNLSLGVGSNRLDPLVLGPQLLQIGAKASGTVLSANKIPLNDHILEEKGYSKWELLLSVLPQNSTVPFQANLTISLSSAEKVAKISHSGAQIPLRYDPLDLQTVSIDSIAMGYPDPYESLLKLFTDQLANVKTN